MDIFDSISPLDFRYYGRNKAIFDRLQPYLSETAMVQYMAKVEVAITNVLADEGICSKAVAKEVAEACKKVTAAEVYAEEDRIKHNVRALANCIRAKVSKEAKPYVHFTVTSHDIICTAEASRYKDVGLKVVVPVLVELEKTLIALAKREKATLQIGRTHGQHAEPITFGFTLAEYISRLGTRIVAISDASKNLRGKIAGAVGAYNASSLFFDGMAFEKKVLKELCLEPGMHSTQIAEPEYMADYVHAIVSAFGVLANLADDMRHLQRSEIAEVGELFEAKQVGSSTMPHKRNPINFENVKSMWKAFMPRMTTMYMDQISEHQRDLTNSASSRFHAELVTAFVASAIRLTRTMQKLAVDKASLQRNFAAHKDLIAAEPTYIVLAALGHPDAHEHVRTLTLQAQKQSKPFQEIVFKDKSLEPYVKKMSAKQKNIIKNPEQYIGMAVEKTEQVCAYWEKQLKNI